MANEVDLARKRTQTVPQAANAQASATKTALINHLRNVHRLSGSHEHMQLEQLHMLHANDHMSGQVRPHKHPPGLEPKMPKPKKVAALSNYGVPMRFDSWGQRIDLATKTVSYNTGTKVVHHSSGKAKKKGTYVGFAKLVQRLIAQGKTPEEAKAIAASIGRRKYGAKKFNAAAAHGKALG